MTTARIIKKKVTKKLKRKGPPHWLGKKSVLSQMEEQQPVDALTAFRVKARDIRNRDDFSEPERHEEYKTIARQAKDRFTNMRQTEQARCEHEVRQAMK